MKYTEPAELLGAGDIGSVGDLDAIKDEKMWRRWRRVTIPGADVMQIDTRIRKCQVVKDFQGATSEILIQRVQFNDDNNNNNNNNT